MGADVADVTQYAGCEGRPAGRRMRWMERPALIAFVAHLWRM
jgi:hypothetical protein